jgi:hypothetical protein
MTNKRGLFENDRIRETIVKPYLKRSNADPKGQHPLLEINRGLWIPEDFGKWVGKVMLDEGYQSGEWMYKDARITLMWPVWHYAFPNAKWVIVRRRTGDIIQSCIKTGYMTEFKSEKLRSAVGIISEEEGWKWWVHQYEKRFVDMITEGVNCKIIWPERMVHGDYQQLYDTLEWLGLKWSKEVLTFIDPLLWGSRKKERSA